MLDDTEAAEEAEEQRLATYRRHKYCFALAVLFTFLGVAFFGLGNVVGRLLTSLLTLVGAWLAGASGVYAVRARQHMFSLTPRYSSDMAFAKASEVGAVSVWIVAGLMFLWGAALLVIAAQVWMHG